MAKLRAATGDVIDDGGAALTACGLATPSPRPETSSVRRVIEGRRRRRELLCLLCELHAPLPALQRDVSVPRTGRPLSMRGWNGTWRRGSQADRCRHVAHVIGVVRAPRWPGGPTASAGGWTCVEIKFPPHAIDAVSTFHAIDAGSPRRLDGVEAHEGPCNIPR